MKKFSNWNLFIFAFVLIAVAATFGITFLFNNDLADNIPAFILLLTALVGGRFLPHLIPH